MFSFFKPWIYIGYTIAHTDWVDNDGNCTGRKTNHMWKLFEKENGARRYELVVTGAFSSTKTVTFSELTSSRKMQVENWVSGGSIPENFKSLNQIPRQSIKNNVVSFTVHNGDKSD